MRASTNRDLDEPLSLYIDLLRILAAAVVIADHLRFARLGGGWLDHATWYGPEGVIAFFVVSGFVISWAAANREPTVVDFAVNRLSRLYSVVVPALAITVALDIAGSALDPAVYAASRPDASADTIIVSLAFANEIWWSHVRPYSNAPFWSLGYEFWYYAIFAAAFYARGIVRLVLVPLLAALVGPKILLLMPAWLFGCAAWRIVAARRCAPSVAIFLWAGSLAAAALYFANDLRGLLDDHAKALLLPQFHAGLHDARFFPAYAVFGILVALNVGGFGALSGAGVIRRGAQPIRRLAGMTFTAYLLHFPLLHFFSALFGTVTGPAHTALILACTLAPIAAIAPLTEGEKRHWRAGLGRLLRQTAVRPTPQPVRGYLR